MQQETTKDRQMKKKKGRTWAEAAKIVLELHPKTPMSHKEILRVIKQKSLKEIGGSTPLACLNSMLHLHSRRSDPLFYKVEGRIGVYGLKCDIPEGSTMQELEEEVSCEGNLDEEEETTKLPRDKKKEKVLYVKLPRGYVTIPAESPSNSSTCAAQNGTKTEVGGKSKGTTSTLSYSRTGSCRFLNSGRNSKNSNNEYCVVSSCGTTNANTVPIPRLKVSVTRKKGCNSSTMLTSSTTSTSPAKTHSKRAIKHALKQQQKRRRKGTAIATAGTTVKFPRIVMKPLPPPPPSVPSKSSSAFELKRNSSTRNECKSRNQSVKTISFKERKCARRKVGNQLETSENASYASIDLETPKSIIVHTDLRALLNKHTFASLPHDCQQELIQLLPEVDQVCSGSGNSLRLSSSALNNEFFTRACQEWKERLADGEFVRENQAKLKAEEERDQGKLDPWKVKHFEPVWGKKSRPDAVTVTLDSDASNQLKCTQKRTSAVQNEEVLLGIDSEVLPPAAKKLKTEHEPNPQVDTTTTTAIEDSNVKPTGTLLPQSSETVDDDVTANPGSGAPSSAETSKVPLPQCGNPPTCTAPLNDTLTIPANAETVSHAPPVAQTQSALSSCTVTVPKTPKCKSNSVNLARSHQICQEVLRSSRNREQELQSKFQLKGAAPPGHSNSASAMALASASSSSNVSARPPSLAVTVKLPKLLLPSLGQPQMRNCYHNQQQQHTVQPLFVSSPNPNGAVPVSLAQMFHHQHHHPVLPSLTINSVNVNVLSCRLPGVVAAPIPAPIVHHQTLPVITLTSHPNVAQVAQQHVPPANHHLLLRPVLVPAATVGLNNVANLAVVTTGSQMAACSTSVSVANCPLSAIVPPAPNGGVGKAQEKVGVTCLPFTFLIQKR